MAPYNPVSNSSAKNTATKGNYSTSPRLLSKPGQWKPKASDNRIRPCSERPRSEAVAESGALRRLRDIPKTLDHVWMLARHILGFAEIPLEVV